MQTQFIDKWNSNRGSCLPSLKNKQTKKLHQRQKQSLADWGKKVMSTAEEMKNVQNFLQQDMKAWSTSAQMFHEKAKQDIPQVAEGFQFYAFNFKTYQ